MEDKVEDIVNLRQGGMSVLYYSLKFTKLSKYSTCLVPNTRDEMSHFVMGVSDDLNKECRLTTLHDNMNIYHFMVHAQQVEETRVKRKSRDVNSAKSFDGVSSKGRLNINDKSRFKKRFSNQVPSKFPKARDDRVCNPKPKNGRGSSSPTKKQTC